MTENRVGDKASDALPSYLNEKNIKRSKDGVEYHPLIPFLPKNGKVLFLGSFPPQRKRWCMDFYYPNFINDHWRIEGLVFFGDKNYFVDEKYKTFNLPLIIDFLHEKGIGFFDTSYAIRRLNDNAMDKFLEVVESTDIFALIKKMPQLRTIVTTGEKATQTICEHLQIEQLPKVGTFVSVPHLLNEKQESISLYRLPSSSRAYPLSLQKKADAYRKMFETFGLI
jgi:G:T/U-mismatch repair DNA glycosylase